MNSDQLAESRFVAAVETTVRRHGLLPRDRTVGVAVSGGADSVAMLAALASLAPRRRCRLAVLHVNHGLRGRESGGDARFVRRLAKSFGCPVYVGKLQWPRGEMDRAAANEERLRERRYEALGELAQEAGAAVVAIGHHRDDQAETVLMNFLRGAGPAGLGGFRPKTDAFGLTLIRPLYDRSREEIVAFCRGQGLRWREDSTNRDKRWLRNRLRHELLPSLERNYNARLRELLADNARWFQEDEDYLEARAREVLGPKRKKAKPPRSIPTKSLAELETPILSRVFRLWVMTAAGIATPPSGRQIEDLVDLARSRRPSRREVRCSGDIVFFVEGRSLTWRKVAGRRTRTAAAGMTDVQPKAPGAGPSPGFPLPRGGRPLPEEGKVEIATGDGRTTLRIEIRRYDRRRRPRAFDRALLRAQKGTVPEALEQFFDADRISGDLLIRNRRAGDRFHPLGARGAKKLKDFLIDSKTPAAHRPSLILLADAKRVLWVAGVRVCHTARLTEATRNIVRLRICLRPNRPR